MSRRRIHWRPDALRDLDVIAEYISRDAPVTARRWVNRMKRAVRRLPDSPHRVVYEPARPREDIHELVVGNYKVVFLVTDKLIDVLMVFDGRRLPPPIPPPEP